MPVLHATISSPNLAPSVLPSPNNYDNGTPATKAIPITFSGLSIRSPTLPSPGPSICLSRPVAVNMAMGISRASGDRTRLA